MHTLSFGRRCSPVVAILALGCSGSDSDPGSSGNVGGAAGFGGSATHTGGGSSSGGVTARGGGTSNGGSIALSGGGSIALSGGGGTVVTTGGVSTSRGGSIATGGVSTSSGGLVATGGVSTSSGGLVATGGVSTSSGGFIATGGGPMTNGGASSGGSAITAGATATGGAVQGGGAAGKSGGAGTGGKGGSGVAGSAGIGGIGVGGTTGVAGAAGNTVHQATCPAPLSAVMTEASVPAGYCAWVFAQGLSAPRGIVADESGQLLVVEAGANAVTLLWDENGDRINQTSERLRVAMAPGLNHGIALFEGHLYASSNSTVYRWPYDGSRAVLSNRQTVLTGLPTGGHSTRTLVFDRSGNLYIAIGSGSNLDANSDRARVVKLDAASVQATGATLANTSVFADGTRNEVGLRFDSRGRLWGVENGSDNLSRSDLGGDIHTDNPAEELNLFERTGAFYGYPYCWTEGSLPSGIGMGPGTQWAYPSVMTDGTHTDAWCRNQTNVERPVGLMQAHTAPLDILFYSGDSFPPDVVGDAIVTQHGSWNRTPAAGYKVVLIPFGSDGMPNGTVTPLLESVASGDTGGGWNHRPVSLAPGSRGEVYVTSDDDGLVMVIGHD